MKTSNKILLGIFLTIIILTTMIQMMVYAKYKRGEYVKFNRESFSKMTSVDIPAIRFISVKGLGSCTVKPGKQYKMEMQNEKVSRVTYRVVNDTLIIIGDPTITSDQLERGNRNYNAVNIFLPTVVPIKGAFSNIRLEGSADSANAPSYNVQGGKDIYVSVNRNGNKNIVYFNELVFSGEQSKIDLNDHITVNNIILKLVKTKFDDKEATIKSITIEADERSAVNLSGKNIKALK